jgi:hypothetical protein
MHHFNNDQQATQQLFDACAELVNPIDPEYLVDTSIELEQAQAQIIEKNSMLACKEDELARQYTEISQLKVAIVSEQNPGIKPAAERLIKAFQYKLHLKNRDDIEWPR